MGSMARNFIRIAVCLCLCGLPAAAHAGVIPWLYDAVFGPHYPAGGYGMYPPAYGAMRPAYGAMRPAFGRPRYAWYPTCAPCAVQCNPCSANAGCATQAGTTVRRADLKPSPDADRVQQAYEGPKQVESKRMPPEDDSPFVESQPRTTGPGEATGLEGGFQPPVKDGDEKDVIQKKQAAPTGKPADVAPEKKSSEQDDAFPKLPEESPFDPAASRIEPPRRLPGNRDRVVIGVSRFEAEWLPRPRLQTPTLAAGEVSR